VFSVTREPFSLKKRWGRCLSGKGQLLPGLEVAPEGLLQLRAHGNDALLVALAPRDSDLLLAAAKGDVA
jgi:hypothetical protein